MGFIRYSIDEVDIWFSLLIGGYYVAKLVEIKSMEKVVLLGNLQKQGSIPIQTVVLQTHQRSAGIISPPSSCLREMDMLFLSW